jgi:hypothetical protein
MTTTKQISIIGLILVALPALSCVVYVNNDSNAPLLLVATNFAEAIVIQKNNEVAFGDPHKHAHFYVFEKRGEKFVPTHIVEQKDCMRGKKIQFSYSDIKQGKLDAAYFSVNPAASPHEPVVGIEEPGVLYYPRGGPVIWPTE